MRLGMRLVWAARSFGILALASGVLAGCASSGKAPVEARGPSRQAGIASAANPVATDAASTGPAVARPGYYIVKRGDTLYSIAHQYERDYREVAAWNGLTNPNVIEVGQELRVMPPDANPSVASNGSKVIAPAPTLEARPIDSPATAGSRPVAAGTPLAAKGGAVTEPKGGRVAYSAQTWKSLQAGEKPVTASAPVSAAASVPATSVPAASAPIAKAEVKTAQSSATAEAKTESRASDAKAVAGDESVEWIWPGSGKVIGTFNDASNKGVDISGSVGDPVLAAGPGRVVYVGSGLRGYGNLVIIKHNNNYLSAYAHNSEILVKEGQSVQKGQKIAALGQSDADRPKLHFEIRRQGKPVDPLKYLPSR